MGNVLMASGVVAEVQRFSPETDRVLRGAGWFPGRTVDIERWSLPLAAEGLEIHGSAERFLAEFGGLAVDVDGPGVTAARQPFSLYPSSCSGEADRILDWGSFLSKHFYPLGEYGPREFFIVIDDESLVYLMADWVGLLGAHDEALEKLVKGVAAEVIAE
jgi:hypothetical protein